MGGCEKWWYWVGRCNFGGLDVEDKNSQAGTSQFQLLFVPKILLVHIKVLYDLRLSSTVGKSQKYKYEESLPWQLNHEYNY